MPPEPFPASPRKDEQRSDKDESEPDNLQNQPNQSNKDQLTKGQPAPTVRRTRPDTHGVANSVESRQRQDQHNQTHNILPHTPHALLPPRPLPPLQHPPPGAQVQVPSPTFHGPRLVDIQVPPREAERALVLGHLAKLFHAVEDRFCPRLVGPEEHFADALEAEDVIDPAGDLAQAAFPGLVHLVRVVGGSEGAMADPARGMAR